MTDEPKKRVLVVGGGSPVRLGILVHQLLEQGLSPTGRILPTKAETFAELRERGLEMLREVSDGSKLRMDAEILAQSEQLLTKFLETYPEAAEYAATPEQRERFGRRLWRDINLGLPSGMFEEKLYSAAPYNGRLDYSAFLTKPEDIPEPPRAFKKGSFFPPETVAGRRFNRPPRKRTFR